MSLYAIWLLMWEMALIPFNPRQPQQKKEKADVNRRT